MSSTGSTSPWSALRTLRKDDSVKDVKLPKGLWKRILGFIKPYRAQLVIFLILIVVIAAIGAANPLVYRQVINSGIIDKDIPLIIRLAALIAVLAVVDAGLSLAQGYLSARIGEGLVYDMRTKVFDHVQKMGLAFFMRSQTGALVSRLDNDVKDARGAFADVLSTVLGNLITVTLTLVAMFALSWKLTLVSLLLLPLFALPARRLGRKIQAIIREGYDLDAQMGSTMVERFNVAGALLVKLFGRQDEESRDFADKAGRVRDISVTRSLYARLFFLSLTLTAAIATAIVYGWGGVMAVKGMLDVGTVVALIAYLNRLYGPLTALSNVNVSVLTMLVSFDRVFEILDLPELVSEKSHAVAIPRGPARVEFDHVCFSYPTKEQVSLASLEDAAVPDAAETQVVLRDVSFSAQPGELIAIVGPSGSGKTTLSYLLPRLYDVNSGAIRIDGIDVRDATLDSLHDVVGMVTQDPHMFHDSIRNNLLYAKPNASEAELHHALADAHILALVKSLPNGLDTLVGERGYRLSGGEKQRLAIARLLLKAPDVVVLDEATAHLDSESELAVQQALANALQGRTSFVIAHRLSTIRDADKIVAIDSGQVVEVGTHAELISRGGLYAELYRTQFSTDS